LTHAVAQSTVNRELSLLRRAFNLARTNEKIHVFPSFKDLLFDESKFVRKKFFEPDEYTRKKAALNYDERPVLVFAYNVGWRKQEVLTLKWDENVDFDSHTVRLWTGETKNDEGRVISMGGPGDELYDMLVNQKLRRDTLCPECPWVFFRANRGNRGKSTFERYNIKNERDMHEARQKLRDYLASQQTHPKEG